MFKTLLTQNTTKSLNVYNSFVTKNYKLYYLFYSDNEILEQIKMLKYKNSPFALARIGSYVKFLLDHIIEKENISKNTLVIAPMPSNPLIVFLRGHLHTYSLIKKAGYKKYAENIFSKSIFAKRQTMLDKSARAANAKLIKVKKNINLEGKTLIIFDDTTTTQESLKAACKLAKKLKPEKIIAAVVLKN